MNLGRIFGNAIARRVAYVLVAMALAWLGLGEARADQMYASQGAAYAGCQASLATAGSHAGATPVGCDLTFAGSASSPGYYTCKVSAGGSEWTCGYWHGGTHSIHSFPVNGSCAAQPSTTFSSDARIPTGSVGCVNGGPSGGCEFVVTSNGDGTYTRNFSLPGLDACSVIPDCPTGPTSEWYMHPGTGLCQPIEHECAANQTKNPTTGNCENACPSGMVADADGLCKPSTDDCPAGNVRSPSGECLPGEGQCAAGEARRPNGTCGRDSDGDGQADEDDEDPENDPDRETASGGDTCSAPPSCSGGPIDCLQVKIQWRIDCNTRHKVNVTGGACAAMPVCVGDNCKAMEYAQLLQQWKAACALEKLANAEPGGGGENEGVMDPVSSGGVLGDDGYTGETARRRFGNGSDYQFDVAGYGWGASCPAPPDVSVFGHTLHFDTSAFCSWMSVGGIFVMIMAHLAGLAILWRA